jgi:hypothetical protein
MQFLTLLAVGTISVVNLVVLVMLVAGISRRTGVHH